MNDENELALTLPAHARELNGIVLNDGHKNA